MKLPRNNMRENPAARSRLIFTKSPRGRERNKQPNEANSAENILLSNKNWTTRKPRKKRSAHALRIGIENPKMRDNRAKPWAKREPSLC